MKHTVVSLYQPALQMSKFTLPPIRYIHQFYVRVTSPYSSILNDKYMLYHTEGIADIDVYGRIRSHLYANIELVHEATVYARSKNIVAYGREER